MAKEPRSSGADDQAGYPLDWMIDVDTMAGHGADFVRSATEDERAALAAALGLVSCEKITVRAHVARPGGHKNLVTGEIRADIVQSCVVTLEPLRQTVKTDLEAELRPAEHIPEAQGAIDLNDDVDVEPLAGHYIPMGRLVFEELAAAIDPYPRKAGAEFKGIDTAPDGPSGSNPFAVLARLKEKKQDKPDG